MTRRIYKYTAVEDAKGGWVYVIPQRLVRVVHVACQDPDDRLPTVWAEVLLEDASVPTVIEIVGTGWPITDDMAHVGSAICDPFVWHLYARARV